MRKTAALLASFLLVACGGGSSTTDITGGTTSGGGSTSSGSGVGGAGSTSTTTTSDTSTSTASTSSASTSTSGGGGGAGGQGSGGASTGSGGAPCGGGCPDGYVCGSANGLEVCRAPSGVPLFQHVFVIVMENTTLSTLKDAIAGNHAPSLEAMEAQYATGSSYHGVAHPSLANYIALTSGDTQGIGCDCKAEPNQGSCNLFTCNLLLGACSCDTQAENLADQLEAAQKSWMSYGEGMGAPCNLTDAGSYAVRHVPFLYYDDVRTDAARCNEHVVDLSSLDLASPPAFSLIAPNLVHDMHDPVPAGSQNIPNGDAWIGPEVASIAASAGYQSGGLLVVVWDEDDLSGGIGGSDDPVPIFVLSPYAKSAGYVSAVKANHYSLLATIEDGLGLPRLGNAGVFHAGIADTLADYFPAN